MSEASAMSPHPRSMLSSTIEATAPVIETAAPALADVEAHQRQHHGDRSHHDHQRSNDGDDAHQHLHDGDGSHDAHHHSDPAAHARAADTHTHGLGGAHTHAIPGADGEPVSWRSLIGLGIFGGLLPCPTAIVVMLSAISLHRVGFGLVLIVAFSIGLATVLTGIGFALVFARTLPDRFPLLRRIGERVYGRMTSFAIRAVPVASALAVVLAGAVVTLRALSQQGFL